MALTAQSTKPVDLKTAVDQLWDSSVALNSRLNDIQIGIDETKDIYDNFLRRLLGADKLTKSEVSGIMDEDFLGDLGMVKVKEGKLVVAERLVDFVNADDVKKMLKKYGMGSSLLNGSGTANQLPLWVDSDTLGDSIAAQTGTTNINVVATDSDSTGVTYALTITHRIA